MKIFKREIEEPKKSWSIELKQEGNGNSKLVAVDSITGEYVASFVVFHDDGGIGLCRYAKKTLKEKGYDPYEHNNKFDSEGRIIIN